MAKKIKVLYILPSLTICNGISSYAMNYFRNIDRERIHIDFLISNDNPSPYFDEISSTDSQIYILPRLKIKNSIKFIKSVFHFFKTHKDDYDIVHCHIVNAGSIYLLAARYYGIKVRILHSHVTKSADITSHKIRNDILGYFAVRNANCYFACSSKAGEYLFKSRRFKVINNAIDIENYRFDTDKREEVRESLDIKDKFVLGTVGRLCAQKNQKFLLDIFSEVCKKDENSVLLIVGNGPLEQELKIKADKLCVSDKVLFLGSRQDVNDLYQAMDVFLLPSIYEGLGIVLIEAQVSGLVCIGSDVIPKDVKVTNLMHLISLGKDAKYWSEEIIKNKNLNSRCSRCQEIKSADYSIVEESKKLGKTYMRLWNEN